MKFFWISGWGVPLTWTEDALLKHLPTHQHSVHPPTEKTLNTLRKTHSAFDCIAGYSLGALLLLKEGTFTSKRLFLLAPFLDLKSESSLGGNIPKAHLKATRMKLKQSPIQTLNHFHHFAQTHPSPHLENLPYPLEDLAWGLDTILQPKLPPKKNTARVHCIIGAKDRLIDANTLQKHLGKLTIIPEGTHSLSSILSGMPKI